MAHSTIVRENTARLRVVRPEVVLLNEEDLSVERDRVLAEARVAGYTEGLAASRVEAQITADTARAQRDRALSTLAEATAKSETAFDVEHRHLMCAAVELGFGIAQAVLARELVLSRSPGEEAIKRALDESLSTERVVVRISPSDFEVIGGTSFDEVSRIIADPSIDPGGCELEVGPTVVDARIETAIERVRRVLDEATDRS